MNVNTKPYIALALLAALAIAIWTWRTKAPPQTGQWNGVSIKGNDMAFTNGVILISTNVTNSP